MRRDIHEHPNHRLTLAELEMMAELGFRGRLISWLQWNDPNGEYSDDSSEFEPLSCADAMELIREQLVA